MVQQAFSQIRGGLEQLTLIAETAEQRMHMLGLYRLGSETARRYGQIELAMQFIQEGQRLVPKVFPEPLRPTDSPAHYALFSYFTQGIDLAKLYPQLMPPMPVAPPIAKQTGSPSNLEKTITRSGPSEQGHPSVTTKPIRWGYLTDFVKKNNSGNNDGFLADMGYLRVNYNSLPKGISKQEAGGRRRLMYDLDREGELLQLLEQRRHRDRSGILPKSPRHLTVGLGVTHKPASAGSPDSTGPAQEYERPKQLTYAARPPTERPPQPPPPPAQPGVKTYDFSITYDAGYFQVGDKINTSTITNGEIIKIECLSAGILTMTIKRENADPRLLSVKIK